MMKGFYYVYILANREHELQIGVACDLEKAVYELGFTGTRKTSKDFDFNTLVHVEEYEDINIALSRERQLAEWDSAKKAELIQRVNPSWANLLYEYA